MALRVQHYVVQLQVPANGEVIFFLGNEERLFPLCTALQRHTVLEALRTTVTDPPVDDSLSVQEKQANSDLCCVKPVKTENKMFTMPSKQKRQ